MDTPRRSRAEWGTLALLALAGIAAFLPTAPFYFRPDDDGLSIFDAVLVLQGQRPYVDFFVHDSPLVLYWHALLLQLGGVDMLTLRLGLVPFKVLLLPVIYLLARPVAPRLLAAAAALLVLMADSGVNFGMPHPGWYGLIFGLLGVLGVRGWLGNGRSRWLFAAGLACGLAIAAKQNLGLFVLGGLGLFLLEPPAGTADSRGLWAVRAAAWATVLAGLLVMFRDQFYPDVLALLWLPVLVLAGTSLWPGPPGTATPEALAAALRRVAWLAAGALLVLGPWLLVLGAIAGFDQLLPGLLLVPAALPRVLFFPYKLPPPEFWQVLALVVAPPLLAWAALRRWPGRPLWALGAACAGAAALLFIWAGPAFVWQGGIYTWYYVPPALIWLALLLAQAGEPVPRPAGRGTGSPACARLLIFGAVFGMLQLYPLMDRVHGAWSFPFTLPLLALCVARGGAWLRRRLPAPARDSRVAAGVLAAALLVLPLFWAWFIAGWRLGLWWDVPASVQAGRPVPSVWQPLGLPHAGLVVPADAAADFQGLTAQLRAAARPGEPIFAFPNEQAFYVMAERPRGTRESYLLPGVTTVADQQTAIADLERNQVRTIVVYMPATSLPALAPLAQYLVAHYHATGSFGAPPNTYAIMIR